MNEGEKFIAKSAAQLAATHLRRVSVAFWISSSSQGVRPLRWQQASSHQVQICERERGVQARRILRQAAVANFAKAPQTLHDVKDMRELPVSVFDAKFRGAKSLGWWVRTGAALGKRGLVVPRHPIGRVRGEGGGVAL